MNITNVTDYDNMTNDYNDSLSINNNCTDIENNIVIINSNTITNNKMRSIIFMFNEFNGIYSN